MRAFFPLYYSLLFLFLLLAAGQELMAQNEEELQSPINKYYQLTGLKMSDNGRWLTAWKSYDQNRDTLLFFDSTKPGNPLGYRKKVKTVVFTGTGQLLMQGSNHAELLNLKDQTSISYRGTKQVQLLKTKEQFVLLYNKDENSKLELHNLNGNLINTLDHVIRFYTTDDDHIYAITENGNRDFGIFRIMDQTLEKVYSTVDKISYLNIAPAGTGIMIREQNPENTSEKTLYLDVKTRTVFHLNKVLPVSFQHVFNEVVQESHVYFLTTIKQKKKRDDVVVDIWYGNDNCLEKKFRPPIDVSTYVWKPRKHFIHKMGNERLPESINIGNNRYYLCFDPCRLQDYRTEQAPLQLFVYDLAEDQYSLLDTISPELYLSGNGNYALSPGSNGWYLYHIPSGSKTFIEGKSLGPPFFTTDDKAILFEGEGALWYYDIKTDMLSQSVDFDGYQTHIQNFQWKGIRTSKGRFVRQQINLSEPLVIELYDPQKNQTGYSLWFKGKTEVIIPPTTKRIQSLKYNRPFTSFSWLEEDFNLPPRLVFKEIGKKETVVFQSNQQDKAILSLKQEIISYTNSDGIALKGILYYPLGYSPSKKYPMVVRIYQKQNQFANRCPSLAYYESLGLNIRLFLDKGYFVYLPDIVIQGKEGPGLDALDCVNYSLDALAHNPLINWNRIGLIGHSFGGYETDYIATCSNRFAAFVAGSGASDIVWDANAFNYNFNIPDFVRIEANQYKLGVPFSADKDLYFKNNPVYHAEKVNAPVLLWSGTEDQNVPADQTMAFYNALRRNQKQVIALFYKGEGHDLQNKQAQIDLKSRILDWFDYFLKGKTEIEWIKKGTSKKDAP